ncbi:NAD(P)-binding domain-containing protein [Amycolatopsis sp. NPDC024027]|uniref:NAD(P)-binding domain-containing protein n=1 Tax=Amycolatopsis sp. NPDC024027 TaxID=3154327 RepID=UPI0034074117
MVEGLTTSTPPQVFLSPRNHGIARDLAGRFPNARICGSNQEVLDHTTAVLIAVRPQVVRDVLAELTFRPDHVVVSAVAGVALADLRDRSRRPGGSSPQAKPLRRHDGTLDQLAAEHMTPGGVNEQYRTALREAGVPGHLAHGLDAVLARLTTQ